VAREIDEFADLAGVGVGFVDSVRVSVAVCESEEDAVGFVADDDGVSSATEERRG
jgi:hypothetical protein